MNSVQTLGTLQKLREGINKSEVHLDHRRRPALQPVSSDIRGTRNIEYFVLFVIMKKSALGNGECT